MGLLSWLGGDRRRTEPPDGAATSVAGTGAAPGTGNRPSASRAWRDLPPLQRTTDGPGLLTDPGGFRASLDTWQDVSLSRPLGHLVSPEAPAGLLYGVASPAGARPERSREAASSAVPPAGPAAGAPAAARPAVALQRVLDARSLTSLDGSGSGPARQLTGLPSTGARPLAPGTGAPPAVRGLPTPPLAPSAPVQRTQELPRTAHPHAHHGLGVGEPLSALPPTAQREPAARSVPAPTRPEAAEPSSIPAPATGSDGGSPWTVPDGPPPQSGPLLGDDPLVPALDPAAPQAAMAQQTEGGSSHDLPRNPPGAGPLTVVGLQRLPAAMVPTGVAGGVRVPQQTVGLIGERSLPLYARPVPDTAPLPDPGPPVVVARWAVGADGPGGPVPGPSAGTAAGTRTGTAERGTGTVTVAPAAPVVQRAAGSASVSPLGPLAPADAAVRQSLAATADRPWADAGSAAVAAGVAQRAADGSVVFTRPPAAQATADRPLAVQRAADSVPEPVPAPEPVSDRASEPVPEGTPPPPVTAAASGGPVGAPPPAGPGDAVTGHAAHVDDELVRALFPRLSRLIKAELRLDRERAGFLISTRH